MASIRTGVAPAAVLGAVARGAPRRAVLRVRSAHDTGGGTVIAADRVSVRLGRRTVVERAGEGPVVVPAP